MSNIVFGDSSDINLTNLRIIDFSTFTIFKAAVSDAAPKRTWSSLIFLIDENSFRIEVNLKKDLRTECKSKFNARIWNQVQFYSGTGLKAPESINSYGSFRVGTGYMNQATRKT